MSRGKVKQDAQRAAGGLVLSHTLLRGTHSKASVFPKERSLVKVLLGCLTLYALQVRAMGSTRILQHGCTAPTVLQALAVS